MMTESQRARHALMMDAITGQAPIERLDEVLHPRHEMFHNLFAHSPVVGVRALKSVLGYFGGAFTHWHVVERADFDDGTSLVGRRLVHVTHSGPLGAIRASEKTVPISLTSTSEMAGDRIVRTSLAVGVLRVLRAIDGMELVDPVPNVMS